MEPTITTILVVLLVAASQTYGYIDPLHLVLTDALTLFYCLCQYLMASKQPSILTILVVFPVTALQTYGYIHPGHLFLTSALALVYCICRYLMSSGDSTSQNKLTTTGGSASRAESPRVRFVDKSSASASATADADTFTATLRSFEQPLQHAHDSLSATSAAMRELHAHMGESMLGRPERVRQDLREMGISDRLVEMIMDLAMRGS